MLEQARATVERDAQLGLYKRSQELVVRDYPSIFVANPHRIAFRDYVKGYRYVGPPRLRRGVLRLHHRQEVAPSVRGRPPPPAPSCASSSSAG